MRYWYPNPNPNPNPNQAKSYVAMRYWYPFTSDALEAIKRDGIERLVVVPLYPQFSISTSGSSLRVSNPNPNPNPN